MTTAEFKGKIDKSLDALAGELRSLRVGRASAELVEQVSVRAYDSVMPLVQVASIQVPSHNLLIIQPWDAALAGAIEEGIRKSDLHLNPVREGNILRIAIPPLTEERRVELAKLVSKHAEEARVSVRNIREEAMEDIEKAEKNKEISEDDKFRQKDEIQKLVDEYNKKVKEMSDKKEEDIMKN